MGIHKLLSVSGKVLLVTGLLLAALIVAYFLILAAWPTSVPKTSCPERSAEELEKSVARYFSRQADQADWFQKTHKFEREKNSYTDQSRAWLVSFSMIDGKTKQEGRYAGIVTCDGRVELSMDR